MNENPEFRTPRVSPRLGSTGILPVAAGMLPAAHCGLLLNALPDVPRHRHRVVRQHAGHSGQHARAPQNAIIDLE